MVGDEIVNVNGKRLRGLSVPDARTILSQCHNERVTGDKCEIDIVIARNRSAAAAAAVPEAVEESSQPLSLLASHDEHDLINLSSSHLHADAASTDGGEEAGMQRTVIKIGSTALAAPASSVPEQTHSLTMHRWEFHIPILKVSKNYV